MSDIPPTDAQQPDQMMTELLAHETLDADIVRAIEAIVLVATEPVPTDQLAQLLEQPTALVNELCRGLA